MCEEESHRNRKARESERVYCMLFMHSRVQMLRPKSLVSDRFSGTEQCCPVLQIQTFPSEGVEEKLELSLQIVLVLLLSNNYFNNQSF